MTKIQASLFGASAGVIATLAITMMLQAGDGDAAPVRDAGPCAVGDHAAVDRTGVARSRDRPVPAASVADPRVHDLETEVARLDELVHAPEVVAVEWPADVPASDLEPAFRRDVEGALRECRTDARLAGLSCDEPPCITVIALGTRTNTPSDNASVQSWSALDRCAAWSHRKRSQEVRSTTIDCGGGRYEQVEVISPSVEAWTLDRTERFRVEARHEERVRQLLAQARCAS